MPENWHKRDACIYPCKERDPSNYGIKSGVVDVEQEYEKAGKEQCEGKMQQDGQRFDDPG